MLERQISFDFLNTHHTVTFHLAWATAVACLGTLQFGFHLSELNGTQLILSCNFSRPGPVDDYNDSFWGKHGLQQCIPIPDSDLSIITTMFVVGGLLSSMVIGSKTLSTTVGRKFNCIMNAILFAVGSLIMAFASSFNMINIGRLLCGLGAGSSVVISPILVNEITPVNHRGFLGSFLQLSLALGIMLSQVLSVYFANDQQWRFIFLFAGGIALLQFVLLFTIVESPKWLILSQNDTTEATNVLFYLRSNKRTVHHEINHWRRLSSNQTKKPEMEERTPLLEDLTLDFTPITPTKSRRGSIDPSTLSVYEFLTSKSYRKELFAIIIIMSGNQLCGMNAITFYGVIFLQNIVPEETNILYLTSALAFCNVVASLMVSPLFDRFGRKPLLLFSTVVMALSSFAISLGMITKINYLTAVACFVFIIGFSFGLGPIVYLMVPEFTNHNAISIGQSFGTVLNWLSNIAIAYFFPLLQGYLKGQVFLVFTGVNIFYLIMIVLFVPETKNLNDYDKVWDKFRYI